jgi:hypothetical protein
MLPPHVCCENYIFLVGIRRVVSRLFHQGKHVKFDRLLGRCNGNQPIDLVTMHRDVRSRCCSEGSWERSI